MLLKKQGTYIGYGSGSVQVIQLRTYSMGC